MLFHPSLASLQKTLVLILVALSGHELAVEVNFLVGFVKTLDLVGGHCKESAV